MNMPRIYLLMAIMGTIAPMSAIVPWLLENGVAPTAFATELFANPISSAFGLDVVISACAMVIAALTSEFPNGREKIAIIAATLLIGVSAGLPLFFYYRERKRLLGIRTRV